jgi:hypothetical protein
VPYAKPAGGELCPEHWCWPDQLTEAEPEAHLTTPTKGRGRSKTAA